MEAYELTSVRTIGTHSVNITMHRAAWADSLGYARRMNYDFPRFPTLTHAFSHHTAPHVTHFMRPDAKWTIGRASVGCTCDRETLVMYRMFGGQFHRVIHTSCSGVNNGVVACIFDSCYASMDICVWSDP